MKEFLAEPIVTIVPSSPPSLGPGRNVAIVTVLTVIVAAVGYLREAALAARFGLSAHMDAYFAAVFIPTTVYMVLIAGTLSPVFIPILLQNEASGDAAKLSETFSVVTNFVLLLLAGIVLVAMLTAHKWLAILFPGFDSETTATTLRLIYIIFPSVIFVGLAGILTAALNGFHKFALAAFAPAMSSIAVIAAIVVARGPSALYMVAIATAVGFVLQLLLLIPATAALGIRYRPILPLGHPVIGKLFRVGGPLLAYLVTANASSFVERNLASHLAVGAISTLTYATRLFAVPSNFLAAPLGVVMYPRFAREAVLKGHGDLSGQVSRMFRAVFFLFLPITIWTMMNALPITRLLFERGQFVPENSLITSQVLRLYSIGILPLALGGILLRCFYAVQDTVTALAAESIDLVFYVTTATLLTRHFGIRGLAFARGASFYLVSGILITVLSRRKHLLKFDGSLPRFICLTSIASATMAGMSWVSFHLLEGYFESGGMSVRLAVVGIVMLLSSATFLGTASFLGLDEGAQMVRVARETVTGAVSVGSKRLSMTKG